MDISDLQTDDVIWKFASGCNFKILESLLSAAKVPTTNCVEGRLQLKLFHAVRMGLLSFQVDAKEAGKDQQKIIVNYLPGRDSEHDSCLGRQWALSRIRHQKLKLGRYITLLHPLQLNDWSRDLTCLLPGISVEQQFQLMKAYLKNRKLQGTQEAKVLAAGKRLSANRGSVHSVEYHPIGDDNDIRVCYVRAMVVLGQKRSSSRTHPYMVWCRIHKQTGEIQEADCHCSPGLESGVCHHILALLYHLTKVKEQQDKRNKRFAKKTCNKATTHKFSDSVCNDTPNMEDSEDICRLPILASSTQRKSIADYDLDQLAEISNGEASILAYTSRFRTSHPTLSVQPDLAHIATDVDIATTSDSLPLIVDTTERNVMMNTHAKLPHVDALGHHLMYHQKKPVVFSNATSHWSAASWTPSTLRYLLKDQLLTFRIGRRDTREVQWETACYYESATVSEFVNWVGGEASGFPSPLSVYSPADNWVYCDYKHFVQQFPDRPDLLKAVDWGSFGFPDRGGEKSTFWMGSAGAHTQCHFDSYGCNLVAQIYGRKRWVLFPPSQTDLLYPTRVPYEESSIFSNVKVAKPNLYRHPKFKETTPYVVTLEPGDVLYIPRHWWHDVTSLTTSISINTWIELPCDNDERIREAITRTVVMTTMRDTDTTWLNPNEELSNFEDTIECLRNALLMGTATEKDPQDSTTGDMQNSGDEALYKPNHKRARYQPTTHDPPEHCSCKPSYPHVQLSTTKEINVWQFDNYCQDILGGIMHSGDAADCDVPSKGLEAAFVDSLSHPHIVRHVCKLLKENIRL